MKNLMRIFTLTLFVLTLTISCKKTPKEKVEDGFEEVGEGIKEGAEKTGEKIKEGHEEVKDEIDDATDEK